ncbi:hypothetical protein P4493_05955 [Bacillus thuringiensis]|uniref:Uncharacterized protein n=3 Tax=Bacillus thuringiensis TaxID=1428 RepID=A0A0B5NPA4_BACTU|nr:MULTISPECIES: hypothetical protein [Bacillus]EAO55625.1 hypothetical protein RBTH_06761 [Bacillus thuringiensis serovar israelensis ATCC 35646]MEC2533107.1 hypothetical protein [Bacillus cereus]MED1153913.1 hypothetical protein [Bacillus paranthracis]OUB09244.1 hypothetical protein BK708_32435 [Bacillus thuringiensis serovar yunnanensis]AFQ29786.1 hypothetical protein BTF1_28427 [Bacillus thuringiensis HD-789]
MGSYRPRSSQEVLTLARQEGIGSCVVEVEGTYTVYSLAKYVVGKYTTKEQINRFLKLVDVKLTPVMEKETLDEGKVTVYKPSKNFRIIHINHVEQVPNVEIVHKIRGISEESVVDVYVTVDRNLVTLYKPIYFKVNEGFNRVMETEDFIKENGTLN